MNKSSLLTGVIKKFPERERERESRSHRKARDREKEKGGRVQGSRGESFWQSGEARRAHALPSGKDWVKDSFTSPVSMKVPGFQCGPPAAAGSRWGVGGSHEVMENEVSRWGARCKLLRCSRRISALERKQTDLGGAKRCLVGRLRAGLEEADAGVGLIAAASAGRVQAESTRQASGDEHSGPGSAAG